MVPGSLSSSTGMEPPAGTNPQAGNTESILPGDTELHSNCASQASGLKILHCAAKCFGLSWGNNMVLFSTCQKQFIWQQGAQSSSEIGVKFQRDPLNLSETQDTEGICQGHTAKTCGYIRGALS